MQFAKNVLQPHNLGSYTQKTSSKACEQYIIDAMDWKADIIRFERVETPEIPIEAIREAVINSYGHRLYNNNQCNEIDVFKDRIEIHTTGGFPKGHTPEEFLNGNKKAIRRNKLITGVLYYSKDMETFATGLKRINDLCEKFGCKVEFKNEKDDFVVVFYRNLRETWETEPNGESNESGSKHQNEVLDEVLNGVLENKIIVFLSENNKLNQKQLAAKAEVSLTSVQRAMKKLVKQGKIVREGGKRFGHWVIK
jgi:ATP-dependent DNA helicase RecG